MMRSASLFALCLLGACATPQPGEPSLAPRAAEAVDPRVPIPDEVPAGPADADLVARIGELMREVAASDASFQSAAEEAGRLASAAGPAQSESWIMAQQAVSAVVAARAPVAKAIADLDELAATRLARNGGIAPGDLAAIQSATSEAAAVGDRQAAVIDRLQAQLAR